MILLTQPNSWSCSLAAAAMVTDISIEELTTLIGHDGSAIVNPDLPSPANRKGFHNQEIIDAVLRLGFAVTPIHPHPIQTVYGYDEYVLPFDEQRFHNHLKCCDGMLCGKARKYWHAVAWDHSSGKIYDPQGRIYSLDDCKISIEIFWRFDKIKIKNTE